LKKSRATLIFPLYIVIGKVFLVFVQILFTYMVILLGKAFGSRMVFQVEVSCLFLLHCCGTHLSVGKPLI